MNKLRVGIDLDGCNVIFIDSCNIGLENEGHDFRFTASSWDFYKKNGWSDQDFTDFCHRQADAGVLFNTEPIPGAVDAFGRIAQMGHEMIIITDRSFGSSPSVSENITCEWLAHWGYEYDELVFSSNKLAVQTDVFVEDKISNYDALVNAGVDAYLIDRPWNKAIDGRKRIAGMEQYADIIESITNRGFVDLTLV